MAKRITLKDVESWDLKHKTSHVRELEMAVDACNVGSFSLQFFNDCRLYSLKEACSYLCNYMDGEGRSIEYGKVVGLCTALQEKITAKLG